MSLLDPYLSYLFASDFLNVSLGILTRLHKIYPNSVNVLWQDSPQNQQEFFYITPLWDLLYNQIQTIEDESTQIFFS